MKKSLVKGMQYTISIFYVLVLFKIVLLKYYSISDVIDGGGAFRSYNFVPFQIVKDYVMIFESTNNWLRGFANIFGNIVIFVPFGLLLPTLFDKMRKSTKLTFLTILCSSILFESLQYIFALGTADIDDIILNVLGGGIGVALYHLIARMVRKNIDRINITVVILLIAGSIPAYYVAKIEFGNLLGLTQHEIVRIGNEEIPTRPVDAQGSVIKITNGQVVYFDGIKSSNETANSYLKQKSTKIVDSTKMYWRDIEASRDEAIFTYREISSEDFENIDENTVLQIWLNENTNEAEVIVFYEVPGTKGNEDITADSSKEEAPESNDYQEIEGTVLGIEHNKLVVNLKTIQELVDGAGIAMTDEENVKKVVIELTNETEFIKRISTDGVTSTDKEGKFEDLEVEQSVIITGKQVGDVFIADKVIMYEFK